MPPIEWEVRLAEYDLTPIEPFIIMAFDVIGAYRTVREIYPDHRILSITIAGEW